MGEAMSRNGLTERTTIAIRDVMSGDRRGLRAVAPFVGPAVIASVAYMDPGNFATNIQAGASYGYGLLWVVVVANVIAMLFQALSARLGVVTNRNLAELSRDHFPRPVVIGMWLVSEVAAMATDLAEFLGGAIGLSLLAGLTLMQGMAITAVITYALLLLERRGFRPLELVITGIVGAIALCYAVELLVASPDWGGVAQGVIRPRLPDNAAILLSVSIIGATVMPHAIYLHSSLTQARAPARSDRERRALIRFSDREVVVALTVAGLVNMAMVIMAAAAFHDAHPGIAEIGEAYHTLGPLLGAGAASVFLVSLMASGISSSVVGTMAGQVIMQGFAGFSIPIWCRRLVTMVPAFGVVALGFNETQVLVISQVVLSFALPVPMIAMLCLMVRPSVMGDFVIRRRMVVVATAATLFVLVLNAVLIATTFGDG